MKDTRPPLAENAFLQFGERRINPGWGIAWTQLGKIMKKEEFSDVQVSMLLESNYTWQEDIERGFLVDVTKKANASGLFGSVAMRANVYEKFAGDPGDANVVDKCLCSDEIGFILWVLGHLLSHTPPRRMRFLFRVIGAESGDVRFELKAIREVNEEGAPFITILDPDEEY